MVYKKQTSLPSPKSHCPLPEVTVVNSLGSPIMSFLHEIIEFLPQMEENVKYLQNWVGGEKSLF